ncbi:MAG TPA: hypothetical protein VLH84_03020 [Patescibacteria group bacterium]|nr:hypothetical protein [Patescibacteria group bacterium]
MHGPEHAFLHDQNADLHSTRAFGTEGVAHVVDYLTANNERVPNQPADRIAAYVGFLADEAYVNDGILTGDRPSIDRQISATCVQLTPNNAEAYVKFQVKIAREQGAGGDVNLESMDEGQKMELLRTVRKDQVAQLGAWADELNSDETNYPDWFKYWAYKNVTGLTAFNPAVGKTGQPKGFEERSKGTFALFPELHRDSLSIVYQAMVEKLGGKKMDMGYEAMRGLLDRTKFKELYAEAQNYGFKITDELKAITTGSWTHFPRSNEDGAGQALSAVVRAYRTGWCTAGAATAATQLAGGDFYVWRSHNPGTDKEDVPRIAVRMQDCQVAEVRGVNPQQELEPELVDTAIEMIRDLPGGDTYFQKAEDMKRLTAIEKRVAADPDVALTADDVRFLYELEREIQGFGYTKDPRIVEIRARRADKDKPEIIRAMPESIRAQLAPAGAAYRAVAERLSAVGESALDDEALAQLFDEKDQEWRAKGVYEYVTERLLRDNTHFVLTATPNVEASAAEITGLSEYLHTQVPARKLVGASFSPSYSEGYHTDSELSGNHGEEPARFSLIPLEPNKELTQKTVTQQMEVWRDLAANQPGLNLKPPSVLDTLAYWYGLRARGDSLNDDAEAVTRRTLVSHFDLGPKLRNDGQVAFPYSYIEQGGYSHLLYALAYKNVDGRLAVG